MPGELKTVRPRRRHTSDGGEDDVRPATEGDGLADERGGQETGHVEQVYVRSSGNGLLQCKDSVIFVGNLHSKRANKINHKINVAIYCDSPSTRWSAPNLQVECARRAFERGQL